MVCDETAGLTDRTNRFDDISRFKFSGIIALDHRLEDMDVRVLIKFVLVAVLCGIATSLPAQWPGTTNPDSGRFWAEAGGMALDRPGASLGITLIFDSVTLAPLYTSDDITDLNGAAGGQFRFGSTSRMLGDWEFGGSTANWDTQFNATGDNLESPLFPGFSPDSVDILYNSDFYNMEFNLRRAVSPGLTLLIGPRFFSLQEDLQILSETEFSAGGVTETFLTGDTVSTRNSSIGAQVGFEFNMPVSQAIYMQGFFKAAGMGTSTTVDRTSGTNFSDTIVGRDQKSTGTFIGQAGGRVYCEIFPRTLTSYAGYEATWVDGIALAPTQFLNTGTESVITSNTVFWHAITFGLRFTY